MVVGDARFCKQCGAALSTGWRLRRDLDWNPWVAVTLSLVPGLGQFYKGQRWQALLWLTGVLAAYYGAPPFGLLLHLVCLANAGLAGAIDYPGPRLSSGPQGGLVNR